MTAHFYTNTLNYLEVTAELPDYPWHSMIPYGCRGWLERELIASFYISVLFIVILHLLISPLLNHTLDYVACPFLYK